MKEFKAPVSEIVRFGQSDVIAASSCRCVDCQECPAGKDNCQCVDFTWSNQPYSTTEPGQ